MTNTPTIGNMLLFWDIGFWRKITTSEKREGNRDAVDTQWDERGCDNLEADSNVDYPL